MWELVIEALQFRHNVWPSSGFVNVSLSPSGERAGDWSVERLSVRSDGVMFDQLLVELEAKPGRFGHGQVSVAVDPWLGDQHLTQRGGRPAGRLVRKFKPRMIRDRRHEVKVGEQADSMGPGMRGDHQPGGFGECRHLPQL